MRRVWTPPAMDRGVWLALVVMASMVALAHAPDRWAWHALHDHDIERHDWYQMLRAMGYMPTWGIVGGAVLVAGWWRRRGVAGWWRAGVGLAGSPVVAGIVSELVKVLIGRERPAVFEAGERAYQGYVFKAWDVGEGLFGAFSGGGNLGIPSSHTAVAVAGAMAAGRLFPGAGWVLGWVAIGCALTRLLSGAHFLSDVVAGAALGYACAWLVVRPVDLGRGPELGSTPSA